MGKWVQEPDNLLTNPGRPKVDGEVFIVTSVQTSLLVGGESQKVQQLDEGIIGFMVVFNDYEKALAWAGGNSALVLPGSKA